MKQIFVVYETDAWHSTSHRKCAGVYTSKWAAVNAIVKNHRIELEEFFDEDEIELFRKVYSEGKAEGEFDIDNVELVADITHYCIKGLEVPYIYGRLGHGMTEETSKPLVAKVVYGALGKSLIK